MKELIAMFGAMCIPIAALWVIGMVLRLIGTLLFG